jgi:hypothetical protein
VGDGAGGFLARASCILVEFVTYADLWRVEVDAPTEVQIEMTSFDFEPYIVLVDEDDNWLGSQVGYGGIAAFSIPMTPGTYWIWASTDLPDDFGSYTLTVEPLMAFRLAPGARTDPLAMRFALEPLHGIKITRVESGVRARPTGASFMR